LRKDNNKFLKYCYNVLVKYKKIYFVFFAYYFLATLLMFKKNLHNIEQIVYSSLQTLETFKIYKK